VKGLKFAETPQVVEEEAFFTVNAVYEYQDQDPFATNTVSIDGFMADFTVEEQSEINDFLAKYGNAVYGDGFTPFHYAAQQGYIGVVKFFVSNGTEVNIKASGGFTPLHVATSNGRVEVAKYLVSVGADVNAKDNEGFTPLHNVSEKANIDAVEFLVSMKADVNAKTNHGYTPLHFTAGEGHIEIAKFLVEAGADVNAKTNRGFTPLYFAAVKENIEVAKFLVSVGANAGTTTVPPISGGLTKRLAIEITIDGTTKTITKQSHSNAV